MGDGPNNEPDDLEPDQKKVRSEPALSLSVPWGREDCHVANVASGIDPDGIDSFIKQRTELHVQYIREAERTRRIGMILAAILLSIACIIPVFAPAGRETASYIVSLALLVFSAGSMGYSTIHWASEKQKLIVSSKASRR